MMSVRVAKSRERAVEDAYRLAALRRRALAEVRDAAVRADGAAPEACQAEGGAGPGGDARTGPGRPGEMS